MRNIRSLRSLFLLVLLAAGCGYWGRRSITEPTAVDPRAPVWIWSGGEVMKWHAVFVTPDSVSGIPFEQFEYCRSCRRTIPRSRVDSMKAAYRTIPQNAATTMGLLAALTIADGVVCYLLDRGDPQC